MIMTPAEDVDYVMIQKEMTCFPLRLSCAVAFSFQRDTLSTAGRARLIATRCVITVKIVCRRLPSYPILSRQGTSALSRSDS